MQIEFCTKLNFLEGEYAITQNIGFLLSWVGTPCRYVVLRPCKKVADFVEAQLAPISATGIGTGMRLRLYEVYKVRLHPEKRQRENPFKILNSLNI
jgi:hypothetical protein